MKKLILISLCIACILSCTCAHAIDLGDMELYPKLTVVVDTVELSRNWYIVACMDKNGDIWEFYNDEGDWEIGDIAILIMEKNENGDMVIDVMWEGYTEDINNFMDNIGWQ